MSVDAAEFFSKGKISFPVTRALAFALKSIRIRLGRMMIVLMGVASAIAFMTMLFSMAAFAGGASAAPAAKAADSKQAAADADDPARVMEIFGAETVDSSAVAKAFRPWWLVIAVAISIAGITNAILMSVTERIKEIGTLQCLGAMSYHIVEIFLFESAFIGIIGGIMGALAGIGLAVGNLYISGAQGTGMRVPGWWELLGTFGAGVFFSMVICLVASVVPVVVAARIQPADAMRYEV